MSAPTSCATGSRINIGEERYVVSMFVDMRGSTKLAEARLPFDIVFLINRFVEAASQAVIDAGGQPNQFVGDGVLALFGLDADPATACRQALRAAAMVASNVAYLNHQFATEVREPIQFGIGIHGGEVIIGDIGFRGHTVFTALGDAVNVAARLQDMTKTLNCKVVMSEEVCKTAGIASTMRSTRTEVAIRGRDEPMTVRTAVDPTVLASLLDPASCLPTRSCTKHQREGNSRFSRSKHAGRGAATECPLLALFGPRAISDLISVMRTKAVPIALGAVLFVLDAGVASR